jgi:hypothetical protein
MFALCWSRLTVSSPMRCAHLNIALAQAGRRRGGVISEEQPADDKFFAPARQSVKRLTKLLPDRLVTKIVRLWESGLTDEKTESSQLPKGAL